MWLESVGQSIGLVILYAITGFGPGFMLGAVVGNIIGAKGKQTVTQQYQKNIKEAELHNAQWHPSHKKWH